METYKVMEGFETYSVSDFGNVKNNKTGRIKNVNANLKGYVQVSLNRNNKKYTKMVHVFVAVAFLPNPENKRFVDHIDNCKTNNNITNLRWATSVQNGQNRTLNKNSKTGQKGVSYEKKTKKWQAYIYIDGLKIHLGKFTNIEDAKQARIIKANQAFGIYTNACEKII